MCRAESQWNFTVITVIRHLAVVHSSFFPELEGATP